jgi:hypothetical protein
VRRPLPSGAGMLPFRTGVAPGGWDLKTTRRSTNHRVSHALAVRHARLAVVKTWLLYSWPLLQYITSTPAAFHHHLGECTQAGFDLQGARCHNCHTCPCQCSTS